jgi:hypothetical protein
LRGLATGVLTLVVGAGFATSAHADSPSFEVHYESGTFVLYNVSPHVMDITDISVVDGDLSPLYHGFFDCMGHTLDSNSEGCTLYLGDSTYGTLAVTAIDETTSEEVSEDVSVSM